MGLPPYGYIKDPNNPKHWVIDEEAAQVVRRIFDMTLEGFGTEQIATQFEKEGILTPQAYWIQKGIGRPGKTKMRPATKWNGSTITHLLYQQEYCGDVLNFKTYSKSYKNKKRIHNDPENWVVFQNVHEPIIERAVFEQVQQKRGKNAQTPYQQRRTQYVLWLACLRRLRLQSAFPLQSGQPGNQVFQLLQLQRATVAPANPPTTSG